MNDTTTQTGKYEIPQFVDVHCHVDLLNSPLKVLHQADRQSIGIVAATNTPSVFEQTAKMAATTRYTHPALGLHPQLVKERTAELKLMWQLFDRTRFIGEIGLDYTDSDPSVRGLQRKVFSSILERCEASGDKILIVHSRRAAADVVSAIGGSFRGIAILHWYSGSKKILEQALQNGLYFAVNLAMFRSKRGNKIIQMLPTDRVLTETDSPFASSGRNPSMPFDVKELVLELAAMWDESQESTRAIVMDNYLRCLNRGKNK
jgi:TatD DNase family protein